MKRKLTVVVLAALVGLLACSSVFGQTSQQVQTRFRTEYERTQEVIVRAEMVIAESRTDRGTALVKIAVEIQERARQMGQNRMFAEGTKLTLSAREKARSAIMVSRQAEENENLVQRQLEKTDNLIARVQNRVSPDAPRMMLALFDAAKENQRRAWEFYRNRELRPALKMSRQAEKSLRGLIERFKSENGETFRLRNQLRQQEKRAEQLEAMIQECGSSKASRLMVKATEALQNSLRFINNGELDKARNRMRITSQLLTQIADLCSDQGSLERMIIRVRAEIQRTAEAIGQSGESAAFKLLESARNHLHEAENLCAKGNTEACAANIKAAQMSVRKAKSMAGI